jgi:hypothetical protein
MDVGTHGLSCPGPQEYAALALFMQCEAERIDEILTEQTATMELLTNRATIIVIPNANISSASAVNNLFDTVLFDNSAFLSLNPTFNHPLVGSVPAIAIGSASGAVPEIPYLRGLYEVCLYVEAVATVPAINTFATAIVEVWDSDGVTQLNPLNDRFQDLEDSTGTIRINAKLTIELTGTSGINVTARLFSGNAAAVSWNTPSSISVRFLGPNEQVETL